MKKKTLIFLVLGFVLAQVVFITYKRFLPKNYIATYILASNDIFHMNDRSTAANFRTLEALLDAHPAASTHKFKVYSLSDMSNGVELKVSYNNESDHLTMQQMSNIITEIDNNYAESYKQNKLKILGTVKSILPDSKMEFDVSNVFVYDFFPHFNVLSEKKISHGVESKRLNVFLIFGSYLFLGLLWIIKNRIKLII